MPANNDELFGTREMAIYWFDGDTDLHILGHFTTDRDSLLTVIDSIDMDIRDYNSTYLNGAVMQGISLMMSRLKKIRGDPYWYMAIACYLMIFTVGTY